MILLCGWIVYAFLYGTYWCTKKLICALSRKTKQQPGFSENSSTKIENTTSIMVESNTSIVSTLNVNSKSTLARWIVGIVFVLFMFVNGIHYSSIFLLFAAFLMFPLSFKENFFQTRNIRSSFVIILSVIMFVIGASTASKSIESSSDEDAPSVTIENYNTTTSYNNYNEVILNSTTTVSNIETDKPSTTTASPTTTTSNNEKTEMVWVSSTGSKYHSKSSCSNMTSPQKISLNDAVKQGYTPCKKCH